MSHFIFLSGPPQDHRNYGGSRPGDETPNRRVGVATSSEGAQEIIPHAPHPRPMKFEWS